MRVVDSGHKYALHRLDGEGEEILTHVKREGSEFPGNIGRYPGTNVQEVMRAEIDRMQYLDAQEPHWRNKVIIEHLRRVIENLELRAAERHGRSPMTITPYLNASSAPYIEDAPFCLKCGHVGCEGDCVCLPCKKLANGNTNPVHPHENGTWWFWDETWANEQGPYATEDEANEAVDRYCKEYLGGPPRR